MKEWTSNAEWPEGSIVQSRANNKTIDYHETESQADAVCRSLKRDGLGGEGKIFPVRTWYENVKDKQNV